MTRPFPWRGLAPLILTIGACGQPFLNSKPQPAPTLSDQPMDPAEPLSRGVVQAVLEQTQTSLLFDSLVAPSPPHWRPALRTNWPDTAKTGWDEALSALQTTPARGSVDTTVAYAFDVTFVRDRRSVAISPIGFSHDSTCAVVYYQLHGNGRGGRGGLLFLARRPGYEWTVLVNQLLWIS